MNIPAAVKVVEKTTGILGWLAMACVISIVTASHASAYRVWMTAEASNGWVTGPTASIHTWFDIDPFIFGVGDTLSVTVTFDTEGAADVMLLAVGFTFDETVLE